MKIMTALLSLSLYFSCLLIYCRFLFFNTDFCFLINVTFYILIFSVLRIVKKEPKHLHLLYRLFLNKVCALDTALAPNAYFIVLNY